MQYKESIKQNLKEALAPAVTAVVGDSIFDRTGLVPVPVAQSAPISRSLSYSGYDEVE